MATPVLSVRDGITGTVRSEVTKVRSVRSTYWALIVLVAAGIAWSVADCAGTAAHWGPQELGGFDPAQASVVGLALLGQLVVVVLGALTITAEYGTGMIRTSLAAMPRRGVMYWAKAVTLATIILVVATVASFAAFFLGQYLLRGTHDSATLGQPGVLRAVVLTALYLVVSALFAFGLGAVIRSTAGALTAAFGVLLLLPRLAQALPSAWYADIIRWLPGAYVVNEITATRPASVQPHMFGAWGEFAVSAGYAVILLAIGAILFSRRDA